MPWGNDDQNNNGSGGPWGQGPWNQKPEQRKPQGGGRGPQPPNLDDLLKKAGDALKSGLPPGSGRAVFFIPLLLGAAFVLLNCVYTVQPDEQGVVMRFGKYNRTADPGLHFLAWPMETVEKPRALAERILTFGVGTSSDKPNSEGLMLTGDQNIVDIEFTVLWRISDPRAYLFNTQDPERLLRVVSESAMREYVGRSKADEVRTRGRDQAQIAVQKLIQDTLDSYQAGMMVTSVQLNKAEPPAEVMDAFAEVNRAQQDSASQVNQATQYAFQRQGQANGEAAKIKAEAEAFKGRVIAEADGEAQRLDAVYNQYVKAKDVTRQRIYIETMEDILAGSNKVIIEQGGNAPGVMPYLPLPPLASPSQTGTNATEKKP